MPSYPDLAKRAPSLSDGRTFSIRRLPMTTVGAAVAMPNAGGGADAARLLNRAAKLSY
jgi:hypothetical protein